MTDEANWNGDAPFSDNFHWVDTDGFRHQITVRANTGAQLLERIDAARTNLMKRGATPSGQQAANSRQTAPDAPGQAQTPPPTSSVPPLAAVAPEGFVVSAQPNGGTATCAMIEVGTSYMSGKTQLKFHCDGFENPLTYTKGIESMVKLLAQLGFTAAHIVVGQKYPVNALVRWVQKGDYKDVLEVHSA